MFQSGSKYLSGFPDLSPIGGLHLCTTGGFAINCPSVVTILMFTRNPNSNVRSITPPIVTSPL